METYRMTEEDLKRVFGEYTQGNLTVMWYKIAQRLAAKRIPVTMCVCLGSGTQGKALQINDKTVIKVSDDKKESDASYIVKQNPSVYFPRIHDVFKLHMGRHAYKYFIVQEKLERCDEKWAEFCDGWNSNYITPYIVRRMKEHRSDNEGNVTPESEKKFKWIHGVAMYFTKHRIRYCDLHGGNLMQKNGKHKIIDLGYSKVKHQKIDKL